MLIYYILLAAAVIAGIPLCREKCGKWGRIVYCAVFAVAFAVISAVRFEVGYDYNLYGGAYFNMMYADIEEVAANRMEKGFLLPFYFLELGFESYWVAFIYTSVIIYFPIFAMICTRSETPWISVCGFLCFGIFFNSLCFLRQIIAAIVLTYAIRFIEDKIPYRFFILVLCASVFHWSALIMLGMYFLLRIKPSWIYLGIVAIGTVIFCIFSRKAMFFFIENFYMYRGYNPETSVEASGMLPPTYTIMFGLLFLLCFLLRKKLIEKNSCNSVYINCLMFTTVFEAMGTRHAILSRFAVITYLPPILFMLPDVISVMSDYAEEKKGGVMKWFARSAAALYGAAFYTLLIFNNYNGVVPYVSQFNRPYDIFVETKDTGDEPDYYDEDDEEDEEDYEIDIDDLEFSE